MKSLLVVISRQPYAGTHVLEQIEAALVGAVFDCDVSLLFRGDGIWSLQPNQSAEQAGQRAISNVLQALPTYDIERIFVCAEALQSSQLDPNALVLPCTPLSLAEQASMIAAQDAVIGAQP